MQFYTLVLEKGDKKHVKEEVRKKPKHTTLAPKLPPAPLVEAAITLESGAGFCALPLDLPRLLSLSAVTLTSTRPEVTFFCKRGCLH